MDMDDLGLDDLGIDESSDGEFDFGDLGLDSDLLGGFGFEEDEDDSAEDTLDSNTSLYCLLLIHLTQWTFGSGQHNRARQCQKKKPCAVHQQDLVDCAFARFHTSLPFCLDVMLKHHFCWCMCIQPLLIV